MYNQSRPNSRPDSSPVLQGDLWPLRPERKCFVNRRGDGRTVDSIWVWFNHSTVGNTHTHTQTASPPSGQQHRKECLSGCFHGNDDRRPNPNPGCIWTFTPEDVCECVCVHYAVSKHTNLGWTRWPSLNAACGPSWESGGHKHTSNTHTHTHAFFHQHSSDDKTFPRRLHMKFSDLLSALMDVAVEPVCRCAPGVFSGFLCALCLDCGLLLTSLWLQTHWHVIYGNEPWRKLGRINQTHPTCTVCVFGKERDGKRQDTNK